MAAPILALLLVVFGCAGTDPRPVGIDAKEPEQEREAALERQALAAMQAGNYEDGIRIYQRLLEKIPDHGRALYHTGYAYGRLGEIDSEIHYYEAAADAGYRTPELFVNLGEAYLGRGQPQAAAEVYRRALNLDTGSADAHFGLGRALLEQYYHQEALSHLEQAVSLAPEVVVFREYLGLIYESTGRLEDARRQFSRILQIDPGDAGIREHLQEIIRRQEALEDQPAVGGE